GSNTLALGFGCGLGPRLSIFRCLIGAPLGFQLLPFGLFGLQFQLQFAAVCRCLGIGFTLGGCFAFCLGQLLGFPAGALFGFAGNSSFSVFLLLLGLLAAQLFQL